MATVELKNEEWKELKRQSTVSLTAMEKTVWPV